MITGRLGWANLHDRWMILKQQTKQGGKRMKRLRITSSWFPWLCLAAVWAMLSLAMLHNALADEPYVMYIHVRDGTYLNGRRSPTRDSAVEMRLFRGDAVLVLAIDGTWAQIDGSEAGTCWCCVEYLAAYPPDDPAPLYTVTSNGRVRIREGPDGETIGYVRAGDIVEVRFIINGWAYIGTGYVMTQYLQITESEDAETWLNR